MLGPLLEEAGVVLGEADARPSLRLHADFEAQLGIGAVDVEVTIVETPRHDWAIRGTAGDELELNDEVEQ